ncbi:MAG: polymer-forming cytoskeletal protein [bacterium]
MIFHQKNSSQDMDLNLELPAEDQEKAQQTDDVETVVGPSVNVEGDLSSSGNIVVKGSVSGNVTTSKHLTVEKGAIIMANIKVGSASISGDIKGNMKIKETLDLTSSSRVLGDINVKTLSVEPGAVIYGKIIMPGVDIVDKKSSKIVKKGRKSGLLSSSEDI